MLHISIAIPCYDEQQALLPVEQDVMRTTRVLPDDVFGIMLVDNGSTHGALKVLHELSAEYICIVILWFSRDFGKRPVMLAGLGKCRRDTAAVMDACLQASPSLLPKMRRAIRGKGIDCAATLQLTRKGEPLLRALPASYFYKSINAISTTTIIDVARALKQMRRAAVAALLSMRKYRFPRWVVYRTKWIRFVVPLISCTAT